VTVREEREEITRARRMTLIYCSCQRRLHKLIVC